MKKFMFTTIAIMAFISSSMANTAEVCTPESKKDTKESMIACCTATLTYNEQYVDHEESCNTALPTLGNCDAAKKELLKSNK